MPSILPHQGTIDRGVAQPGAFPRGTPQLSEPPGTITDMDNVGILLVTLLIGVASRGGGAWLVLRRAPGSPSEVASERMRAAEQTARADAERARADIAAAEVRVSQAVRR